MGDAFDQDANQPIVEPLIGENFRGPFVLVLAHVFLVRSDNEKAHRQVREHLARASLPGGRQSPEMQVATLGDAYILQDTGDPMRREC